MDKLRLELLSLLFILLTLGSVSSIDTITVDESFYVCGATTIEDGDYRYTSFTLSNLQTSVYSTDVRLELSEKIIPENVKVYDSNLIQLSHYLEDEDSDGYWEIAWKSELIPAAYNTSMHVDVNTKLYKCIEPSTAWYTANTVIGNQLYYNIDVGEWGSSTQGDYFHVGEYGGISYWSTVHSDWGTGVKSVIPQHCSVTACDGCSIGRDRIGFSIRGGNTCAYYTSYLIPKENDYVIINSLDLVATQWSKRTEHVEYFLPFPVPLPLAPSPTDILDVINRMFTNLLEWIKGLFAIILI